MASGSQTLTTYYAKRIIGDAAAANANSALLQTGSSITTNTWIFNQTVHSNYGIKYVYDDADGYDKIELYGNHLVDSTNTVTAWVNLNTGDTYILGKVGINSNPNNSYYLYVNGATYLNGATTITGVTSITNTTALDATNNTGALIVSGGTYVSGSGYFGDLLYINKNSNTMTIGSNNSSFAHIYNSANIPFAFNNTVITTTGNLGTVTYPWNNLYLGTYNSGGNASIYYKGTQANYCMIEFIDNTADVNGNGIRIGGGGYIGIGSGESSSHVYTGGNYNGGSKILTLSSDNSILFYPAQQSGYDASAQIQMTASCLWAGILNDTTREAQIGVRSGAGNLYLYSHAETTGNRGIYTSAHGTGTAKSIIVVDTNNNVTFNGTVNGNVTGNADTATTLRTAREVYTTLGAGRDTSNKVKFDGSADTGIPVSGILKVEHGGTGHSQWTSNRIFYASDGTTFGQIAAPSAENTVLRWTGSAYSWLSYTANNTGSTIVYRNASGNFAAGTITATLSGKASTAGTADKANAVAWTNVSGRPTIPTLTFGTVSGTASFNITAGGTATVTPSITASTGYTLTKAVVRVHVTPQTQPTFIWNVNGDSHNVSLKNMGTSAAKGTATLVILQYKYA